MPLDQPIESVSEADLKSLLASGVKDAQLVQFRPKLPEHSDAGRQEFLSDLASFANAIGGHIIYGVSEEDEEPAGLEKTLLFASLGWLEQAALSGIAPRIPGLRMRVIPLENQKFVLLARIPRTWAGPHMITFQQSNRFYTRNADGRCLFDVKELRAAFAFSESAREKMHSFRLDRVNLILNDSLPVRLSEAPKTVLHILPLSSFRAGYQIDLGPIELDPGLMPRPMEARGVSTHYNYDGVMTFSSVEKFAYSYVQVFRNGCVEAVETMLLEPRDGRKFFPGPAVEREIIHCGMRLVAFLGRLGVEGPYVVMLSFLGVRGYGMFAGSMSWMVNSHPIERDHLFLNEIVLENPGQDFGRAMRPIFNQVWNSCGWPKSLSYDQEGNWREHPQ